MNKKIVDVDGGVTVLGGGDVDSAQLARATALAPCLVAADGGARTALSQGRVPELVVGDMDSLGKARSDLPPDRIIHLAEQETTDFEKCLYSVGADFYLALGVSGSRMDHGLAGLNVLARHADKRVFIISGQDVIFLAPREMAMDLPPGTRLSLFPLGPVHGQSEGLEWPIEGIAFSPLGRIGTSNRCTSGRIKLSFDKRHMLVILPVEHLATALAATGAG
ncbi:MAG: thiamine diphosphokinase [Paracoccaceae bacterium]|nr:thiamine diphosphokinase [Paracoccaceae bacterium]